MSATQTTPAVAIPRPSETARATAVVLAPIFSATPTEVLLPPTNTLALVAIPASISTLSLTMTPSPPAQPTETPSPPTPTPSSTPTLGISSPRVSEKDGMVLIPAGDFLMGEQSQQVVSLDAFWIDRTEVTNLQYVKCVQEGKCKASSYAADPIFNGETLPVVGIDWYNAKNYCEWAGCRLPTEAEWEKAARGTDGRLFPWGNEAITCERANYGGCLNSTMPVGQHSPAGDSPYGVADMAGNVWEWTSSLYKDYPYNANDGREDVSSSGNRVRRGGSFFNTENYARAASRDISTPDSTKYYLGFRCVWSGPDR